MPGVLCGEQRTFKGIFRLLVPAKVRLAEGQASAGLVLTDKRSKTQEGLEESGRVGMYKRDEEWKKQRARQEGGFSWCPFPPRWRRPIQPHSIFHLGLVPAAFCPASTDASRISLVASHWHIRCDPFIIRLEAKVVFLEEGDCTGKHGRYDWCYCALYPDPCTLYPPTKALLT